MASTARELKTTGAVGDIQAVAMTLYGEARGTSLLDRLAVGAVIRERYLRPGWWTRKHGDDIPDDTWEAACRHPWQFTCWHDHDAAHRRNYERMVNAYRDDPDTFFSCLLLAEYIVRFMTDRDVRALFAADKPDEFPTHYHDRSLSGAPKSWGSNVIEVEPRFPSAFRWYVVLDGRPKRRP